MLDDADARQRLFFAGIAERIPKLFAAIEEGNFKSYFLLGVRTINGRRVQLSLRAEVIDGAPCKLEDERWDVLPVLAPERQVAKPTGREG